MVWFLRQTIRVFQVFPLSALLHEKSTVAWARDTLRSERERKREGLLILGIFLLPVSAACGLSHRSSCPSCTPGPLLVSPTQLLPIDSSVLPAATCSLHCQASGTRPSNVPVVWFALVRDGEVVLLQKPDESFFPKINRENLGFSVTWWIIWNSHFAIIPSHRTIWSPIRINITDSLRHTQNNCSVDSSGATSTMLLKIKVDHIWVYVRFYFGVTVINPIPI